MRWLRVVQSNSYFFIQQFVFEELWHKSVVLFMIDLSNIIFQWYIINRKIVRMRLLRYKYKPLKTIYGIVLLSPETKAFGFFFVKFWIAFANILVNKYITNINWLILSHLIRVFKSNSTTHYFWQIPYPSSEFESFGGNS